MLQPHLKIKKIAKNVIVVGDPARVKRVISHLKNVKEIGLNRGYRSCEGEYKGVKIAAVSHGIGSPSAAIVVEELAKAGAENVIRVGTCGGLLKEMQPGDLVIPNVAMCFDGTTKEYDPKIKKVEADKRIVAALIGAAEKEGARYFVGTNRTHDAFYEPTENFIKLSGKNYISSEMECSAIFLVSKLRKMQAGAILVVVTPEPPEEIMKNPNMVYALVDEKRVRDGIELAIKIALQALHTIKRSDDGRKNFVENH
ncbi:MAG: nucleoside phosphorylase [Candidatus Marsarchaeota archaeon]|jgi:uridine phosphorylase|nr:nucleoside phosphorylase [Candidatus Marsarchaeota archaeon]MCL5111970.1 nucleoside phosphorylase [Candidatus Marsarchaeota archaeon]